MAKKTNKKTELPNDLDVQIVKAWQDLLARCGRFFDETEELVVDLAFESSFDEHTHFHFDTDELIYSSDIVLSNKPEVRFSVPYGSRTKSFSWKESELINGRKGGKSLILMDELNTMFEASFETIEQINTIDDLLDNFVKKEPKLVEVLNNATEFLRQYQLNVERKEKYSKLDFFGLF